jgi:hypothetical protein
MMDHLVREPFAEVAYVSGRAVIGKGQDDHCVPADERGRDGTARRRALPALERNRIPSLGQFNYNLVGLAFLQVIAGEPRPEAPRLDANDGIVSGVKGWLLVEHLHPDHKFLQLIPATLEGLRDDESNEPFKPFYSLEGFALENAIQLSTYLIRRDRVSE